MRNKGNIGHIARGKRVITSLSLTKYLLSVHSLFICNN